MLTVAGFIAKWRHVELKERSAAQEHFLDLCHLLGHPTPAESDPTGETFCFEKGIAKHGGGDGFADVWKKGFFGWEYKGRHKDLNAAYNQLLLYPRLVALDTECAARLKGRTLTKLYNVRPAWLDLAHRKLDAAVSAAYGWPADIPDNAILERLLALNLERGHA